MQHSALSVLHRHAFVPQCSGRTLINGLALAGLHCALGRHVHLHKPHCCVAATSPSPASSTLPASRTRRTSPNTVTLPLHCMERMPYPAPSLMSTCPPAPPPHPVTSFLFPSPRTQRLGAAAAPPPRPAPRLWRRASACVTCCTPHGACAATTPAWPCRVDGKANGV